MTGYALAEWLGGTRVLKTEVRSSLDLTRLVQAGLPVRVIDYLVRRGAIMQAEVERIVIPRRTLAHRKKRRQVLTPEESDRLARLARVIARAEATFGDSDKAHRWLRKSNRALDGAAPMELVDTDHGTVMVENVLGRLAHGVYS